MRPPSWLPLLLVCAGCATPAAGPTAAERPPAHLQVENHTPYPWRLSLGTIRLDVAPRSAVARDVPASDYAVVQERTDTDPRRPPARHFPIRLEPGQTYRWPIATVLNP